MPCKYINIVSERAKITVSFVVIKPRRKEGLVMTLSKGLRFTYLVGIAFLLAACSQSINPGNTLLEPQLKESQKLTFPASDAQANGYFGYSVAIDGDFMVVGSRYANGPTGNIYQGTAYLYQKDLTGAWQLVKKLFANDGLARDFFGWSVAISGDTVVVGAFGADIGTQVDQGAAYIFEGGANDWNQVKKLVAVDGAAFDNFGNAVAIAEGANIVVVAAASDDNEDIAFGEDQGSTHIFYRNRGGDNAWGRVKKLLATGAQEDDYFGNSIAISDDTIAVGTPYSEPGPNNSTISNIGSVYIFSRNQGGQDNWGLVKEIVARDAANYDNFGSSVAMDGSILVVGAPFDGFFTTYSQGSAYIFQRDRGGINNWGHAKKLFASDGESRDTFAASVAISNNLVVVGVPYDDTIKAGQNQNRGSAYVFSRNLGGSNAWGLRNKLIASDSANGDSLGSAVSIDGGTIAVGANQDDIDTNVNQGSVYIY
jgi:FG-GAP repeat